MVYKAPKRGLAAGFYVQSNQLTLTLYSVTDCIDSIGATLAVVIEL